MAELFHVNAEPRAAYGLGDPLETAARITLAAGGQIGQSTPMLWRTGVEAIDASHPVVGPAPDLAFFVFPNAVLGGGGAMPKVAGGYLSTPGVYPYYVTKFIEDGISEPHWSHPQGTRARRIPAGISIIHHNLVFGHWLLEMFPKLLLLKGMMKHLKAAPIILPHTAPQYVHDIVRQVMGDWPVLVYDRFSEHVEADVLIAPGLFDHGYQFHPLFAHLIEEHVRWADGPVRRGMKSIRRRCTPRRTGVATEDGLRLFVSRQGVVSSFRKLGNEVALEAVARDFGFRVINPVEMSWRDQVRAFAGADCIAGEFGSGMHNTLFSPRGARVVCLNWIVEAQSRITNFKGQRVGYVLPADDKPRLFSLDGGFTDYEIEPERFRRALTLTLSQDEQQPAIIEQV